MYRKKCVKRKVLPEETAVLDILGILFTLVVCLHSLRVVVVGKAGSSILGMLASEYLLVFLAFVVAVITPFAITSLGILIRYKFPVLQLC